MALLNNKKILYTEKKIVEGGSANLIHKEIIENGTYNAENDGADGYSSVTVDVPADANLLTTKIITVSGTYNAADDGYDGYTQVTAVLLPNTCMIEVINTTEHTVNVYGLTGGSNSTIASGETRTVYAWQNSTITIEGASNIIALYEDGTFASVLQAETANIRFVTCSVTLKLTLSIS